MDTGGRRLRDGQAGFSLVELMVGLTIGLLTILVMVNVMGVADARRRTTTSGADAVTNSQLALYSLERDGKSAGYGMTTVKSALGCPVQVSYKNVSRPARILAPAQILDGPSGAPDTIIFVSNLAGDLALPVRIMLDHPKTDDGFFIQSDLAAQAGDLMLAVPADPWLPSTWCTAFGVTSIVVGANRVMHAEDNDWNTPSTASIMPPAGYRIGDYLINLGRYNEQVYDINEGNLRLRRFDLAGQELSAASTGSGLYSGIVQLQAVYGKDTDDDGAVNTWEAAAPVGAGWQQVIAVRLALVSRSQKREVEVVTPDWQDICAGTTPPAAALCWRPDPNGAGVRIDVAGTVGADWQHYRYQLLETTIPIRNTIWKQ